MSSGRVVEPRCILIGKTRIYRFQASLLWIVDGVIYNDAG
jgi:hypothetical protein